MKISKNTQSIKSLVAVTVLLSSIFTLFLPTLQATTWRLNNRPDIDANFSSLQTAIDAVSAGDTIYIAGSPVSYGDGFASKPIILIGPGIFLGENPMTQVYQEEAMITNFTSQVFEPATSSILSGLKITNISINSSRVTVQRCLINNIVTVEAFGPGSNGHIIIEQSFIQSTSSKIAIDIPKGNNITIKNNYIKTEPFEGDTEPIIAINVGLDDLSPQINLILQNNVIDGGIAVDNASISHNIQVSGTLSGADNLVSYNLGHASQFGTDEGNQENIDMSTVFENVNGTVDKDFQLKANSPAIGAGFEEGDCGMFSALTGNPYILSGMPAIPSIHAITVPSIGTNTLNINIKSVTHN